MSYNYLDRSLIDAFIRQALAEDIGDGDHSSLSSIPKDAIGKAQLIVKDEGILAGITLAKYIVEVFDPQLKIEIFIPDGSKVKYGDIGLTITGPTRSILTSERLILNCMQRMSGIATYTNYLNSLIAHTKAKLLDTRKTTPNFRIPEKWAVKIGGGVNHRYGLFDAIILKDNHVDFAGGVQNAIDNCHAYLKKNALDLPIIVETRTIEEVKSVLSVGNISRIMLDNMSNEQLVEAVNIVNGKFPLEASGGVTEKTISKIAETGVDYISVGALTHSVKSLDISLKAINF